MSHLGFYADERLATAFPQLDVILGAHTHHVLDDGVVKNGVLIAQAGKFGKYVGEVTLTVDSGRVIAKRATLHDLSDRPFDGPTEQTLRQEYIEAQRLLDVTVAVTPGYASDWFGPSPIAELLADGLTEWCDAEAGVIPSGVLLDRLPPGDVTLDMLHRICPHPINPCVLTLDGTTLIRFLEDVHEEAFTSMHVRGLGFRGTVLGLPTLHNIESTGGRWTISGKLIEAARTYRIATVDMFTFGPLLPSLAEQRKRYFMPELLRDVLHETIKRHHVLRKG